MDKRTQNLERLLQKMQTRYGVDDDLVTQLKRELTSSAAKEAKNHPAASVQRMGALATRPRTR